MMTDRDPIVCLQDVRVTYSAGDKDLEVLEGIDLELGAGEFVSLMGQSGSGKSTLLNVIAGLLPPTTGTVTLGGEALYALDDHQRTLLRRAHIGFVFQFFNLVPSLDVLENVALPLWIAGEDPQGKEAEHRELLEMVGLGHRAHHHPSELSGGELQRVTLARALVTKPPLLLADEPTGNVSAKMGLEILELFERVHREWNQTILLVTHNHRDAARAQRVVFLNDGRIPRDSVLTGTEVDEARILSVLQKLEI